jgi:NitT/TauT family transport system substrate-binding protein
LRDAKQKSEEPQSAPLKLTLAVEPYTLRRSHRHVADQKGFDRQEGVEVTINYYSSGLESMNAMINGEAHIATVSDIAFALRMKDDASLRVIASIGESTGKQNRGEKGQTFSEPEDLAGKKIGYSPGTASEYYVHAFLITNRIFAARM